MSAKSQDWFTGIFGEFNPEKWVGRWEHGRGHRRRGKRSQMFESGEMKYIILTLIKEQPRHGYDIIKALEEPDVEKGLDLAVEALDGKDPMPDRVREVAPRVGGGLLLNPE